MSSRSRAGAKLTRQIIALINEMDPYGLEPGSLVRWAEYRIEAGPMATLLRERSTIDRTDVDGIWLRWFDETLSACVGKPRAERFVAQLNALPVGR